MSLRHELSFEIRFVFILEVMIFSFLEIGNGIYCYGPGARFSKLLVITGPIKLFCFQLKTEFQQF